MTAAEREQLLKLINERRKKHGLAELRLSAKMDEQAQSWAEHLHKIGKLQHGGFKGDRGQCIAEGQSSPEAVYKAWMSDPPHRAILLGKSYRELGAGRVGKYWVTDFK
jgi:uncharacterized protein YkwD